MLMNASMRSRQFTSLRSGRSTHGSVVASFDSFLGVGSSSHLFVGLVHECIGDKGKIMNNNSFPPYFITGSWGAPVKCNIEKGGKDLSL